MHFLILPDRCLSSARLLQWLPAWAETSEAVCQGHVEYSFDGKLTVLHFLRAIHPLAVGAEGC